MAVQSVCFIFSVLIAISLAQVGNNDCLKSYFQNALKSVRVTHGQLPLWAKLSECSKPESITTFEMQKHQYVVQICRGSLPNNKQEYVLANIGLMFIEPGEFQRINGTFVVDLHKNYIESVRSGVFSNTGILAMNLSHNKIEFIEEQAFENIKNMEILDLSHNFIRTWNSNYFTNSFNLRLVYVSNNLLSYLPEHILENYRCGYLRNTQFHLSFISIFERAANDRYCLLDFSRNRISSIHPQSFANRTKFGLIDLSGNKISDVPSVWFEDFKMITFNITNNKIKELSFETKKKLGACFLCVVHY